MAPWSRPGPTPSRGSSNRPSTQVPAFPTRQTPPSWPTWWRSKAGSWPCLAATPCERWFCTRSSMRVASKRSPSWTPPAAASALYWKSCSAAGARPARRPARIGRRRWQWRWHALCTRSLGLGPGKPVDCARSHGKAMDCAARTGRHGGNGARMPLPAHGLATGPQGAPSLRACPPVSHPLGLSAANRPALATGSAAKAISIGWVEGLQPLPLKLSGLPAFRQGGPTVDAMRARLAMPFVKDGSMHSCVGRCAARQEPAQKYMNLRRNTESCAER